MLQWSADVEVEQIVKRIGAVPSLILDDTWIGVDHRMRSACNQKRSNGHVRVVHVGG